MSKPYYNVTVIGDYFNRIGGESEAVRRYGPLTLKLPRWEHCQGMCRTHILPELLRKADPTFTQIRQCHVLEIRTGQGELVQGLPIQLMSRKQIVQQIQQNNMTLIPEMYPDIAILRSKFRRAKNNREEFEKQEKVSAKTFATVKEAIAMNQDLYQEAEKSPLNNDPLMPTHPTAVTPPTPPTSDPNPPIVGAGGYHPHGNPGDPPPGSDVDKVMPQVTTLGADNKQVNSDEFTDVDLDF